MYNSNFICQLRDKSINEICNYLNNAYYADLHKNFLNGKKLSVNQNLFVGLYFYFVEKNYEEAKKYYLMAIDKGDSDAMYRLKDINKKIFFQKINENKEYEKIDKSDICLICKCEKNITIVIVMNV
jgi:TPR repeat protein